MEQFREVVIIQLSCTCCTSPSDGFVAMLCSTASSSVLGVGFVVQSWLDRSSSSSSSIALAL